MIERRFAFSAVAAAVAAAVPYISSAQQSPPLEEVIVTGTYIPRASQFDSPSPLVVVGREDIVATGANEIGDLILDLTINTGSQNNPDAFTQNLTTGTTNINLRGLGVSSTLVLLNGRRQVASAMATDRGENFVDTSSLPPLIAMDRIEILKDGATALYGSEAVAGVVNFLTRSDFEGFEVEVGYQDIPGHNQNDLELSLLYGVGNERTHFLAAFSRLDRDMLTTADRRLSTTADDLSQAGNPGSFLIPTRPTHPVYGPVWSQAFDSNDNGIADFIEPQFGLPPVPGAQPPVFADQNCAAVAAGDPKVIPGFAAVVPTPIGEVPLGLCQFDFGEFWSLVPREERNIAYLELTHDFSERLSGRLEYHIADNEAFSNTSPSFPFAQFPVVSAAHPDNPYGVDVQFIGRLIGAGGAPIESAYQSTTRRFAGTLSGNLSDTWTWEVGAQLSENDFAVSAPDVLVDRFQAAMQGLGGAGCDPDTGTAGVAPCFYFNPFGTALTGAGNANPPQLIDDLLDFMRIDARSELLTIDAIVSRELGELAGGRAAIALGVQHRSEEIEYDYDPNANRDNFIFLVGNPDFRNDRNVNAIFAELALPVTETVNLQLAVRHEDYGDVDSTDPKATVLWQPSDRLAVRGSIGTSFRGPSLFQSFGTQTTLAELVDPGVGTPQFFPVRSQANPSGEPLRPEEADVLNFGVTWSITDALELNVDWWSFDYTDVIIEQNAQAILNAAAMGDAQAASQVERDAFGFLERVNVFFDNASSLETDGFDARLAYSIPAAGASSYRVGFGATYVSSYDIDDPQAGRIDGAGKRNFANFATSVPELRANAFFNWRRNAHLVDLYVHHIDSYTDDQVALGQGPEAFRKIGSHTTTDLRYGYTFRGETGPTLSVGAINVFDRDPPHVHTNGGYDSKVHDPRGRVVYARASFRF